jgi:hypothetical protein
MLEVRGMKYSPRNITVACDHKGLTLCFAKMDTLSPDGPLFTFKSSCCPQKMDSTAFWGVVGELLKITRRWASDRVRDSAPATGTKPSLRASVLQPALAAALSSPSERDVC